MEGYVELNFLTREFFLQSSVVVAEALVGCILRTEIEGEITSVRIVETEAYPSSDPASHLYMRSPTTRTAVQLLKGGHLYLYSLRGHVMTSLVTGEEEIADVVFIRSGEPVSGVEIMKRRRGYKQPKLFDITNGPGKLSKALGITLGYQAMDICSAVSPVRIFRDTNPVIRIMSGERINIGVGRATKDLGGKASKRLWRFYLQGSDYLSK